MALADYLADLKAAGTMTDKDVVKLRMAIYPDMDVSAEEAGALFELNDVAGAEAHPAWRELFIEAMTDHVVRQRHPAGHVDEPTCEWLIRCIDADGVVRVGCELELLIKVLETAESVPQRLTTYALEQVKAAVLTGEGVLANGGRLEKGRINADETALVRRVLYASAGQGNLAITRDEAEALFEINDAARGQDNDPAWKDLFSKAIAAAVMTVSGYKPLPVEEATRREAWLSTPSEGVGGFMWRLFCGIGAGGMALTHPGGMEAVMHPGDDTLDEWRRYNADVEKAQAEAEVVDGGEAEWLAARILKDGFVDEAETALLAFLAEESPQIHPALRPLLEQARLHHASA